MENHRTVFDRKHFRKSFKFHSYFYFKISVLNYFPSYRRKVFANLKCLFSAPPIVIFCILNQFEWYDRYIKVDNGLVFFEKSSEKGINFLMQLYGENEVVKKLCLTLYFTMS